MSKVKLRGKYWVDKKGNMWNSKKYTKTQAIEESGFLVDCIACVDCSHCTSCYMCSQCTSCVGCEQLQYCRKCQQCFQCFICKGCVNCNQCKRCTYCIGHTGLVSEKSCNDTEEVIYENPQLIWDGDKDLIRVGLFRGGLSEFYTYLILNSTTVLDRSEEGDSFVECDYIFNGKVNPYKLDKDRIGDYLGFVIKCREMLPHFWDDEFGTAMGKVKSEEREKED